MLRLRATNPKERFPDPGDEEHGLAVRKRLQAAVWEEEVGQRQRVINRVSMLNLCNHNVVFG
ncbi:hypothetical protein PGTUg99_026870 [Puccinia graminis f. sp. tritici]|uniref:Uncharacterized protein n=1 Tax=Puccinia graminis f. sp. tritici TaxID=56615 RepID=A0A5B0NKX3_PUCGR|nr:hypothetical protein PGTUg99_026870 [Puccinia graminis f. sp. tritici]